MKKTLLSTLIAGTVICNSCVLPISTYASSISDSYSDGIQPQSDGLIYSYRISISSTPNHVRITGNTVATDIMDSVGLTNITIERSSNGSNWSVNNQVADFLADNAKSKYVSNYSVPVIGGAYYRVTLTHYAENSSGRTESISNTSNVVWVSSY